MGRKQVSEALEQEESAGGGVRPGTESLGPWGFVDLAQQSPPLRLGLLRREGGRGGTAGLGRRDVSADTFAASSFSC